ncbi:MAG: carbohydrate binding domain-containing protein [Candidatus Kapabacteria bacterium]|nr:carbohydrate binding domain-containing protein [Candidatus Kapabacteria bacterium]
MTRFLVTACCVLLALAGVNAQPLASPYTFSIDENVELDNGLVSVPFEKAGVRGRVKLTTDGHLGFADGSRLRIVGTNLQWSGQWPDSSGAIAMARRFRALGINCVRFNTFDVSWWTGGSILAEGSTTTGSGLSVEQMKKFDWFTHQLRENGVYYVFTFHSVWQPRAGDGVRQPDSLGWGARVPIIFDAAVQKVHRSIIRVMLEHTNPHTGFAYKDDPALAYIVAVEDATLIANWIYTGDVVRPNPGYANNTGAQHVALIDSLWTSWLRAKGYTTDATLNSAWTMNASSTDNLLRNGGFEDPFNAAWQLGVSTDVGAQAILQYSDAEKKEGASSGRVRINAIEDQRRTYTINLYQRLAEMKRLSRYQLTFWAKTTPQRGSRSILAYAYNGMYPYDNYGLNQEVVLTSTWKQYSFTFMSRATDEATANLSFFLGADSGDVYLDDVQLREVSTPGLRAGESITTNRVPRNLFLDESVSSKRYKDNATFYYDSFRSLFVKIRQLVRDTLKSEVLLCPSSRLVSFFELNAVREYDVFSSTDWRNNQQSMLSEAYGGSVYTASQSRLKGKAFVVSHSAIAYPRPYQSEMMTVYPAYAGLQDWDGIFFSVFTENPQAGKSKTDSNSFWNIYDKPNVLSLFPLTSSMIRSGDVAPSTKEIVIDNTQEAIDQPRIHSGNSFSLRVSPDARMPLFRRVSMNPTVAATESFMPHLEISALSNEVDVAALDAENEQIFWDATRASFRVTTPRYVSVSGGGPGQIITLPSMIIEQTSNAVPPSIAIASLTQKPILESERSILAIGTRAQNAGTVFNQSTGVFTTWGSGLMMMEGVSMRITLTAPLFDSLVIQPLGNDGKAKGTSIPVERKTGGRFTINVNTQQYATPWYRLEFSRQATSVDEYSGSSPIRISPNPIVNGQLTIRFPEGATRIRLFDVTGVEVANENVSGTYSSIDMSKLTTGAYFVSVYRDNTVIGTSTVLVR